MQKWEYLQVLWIIGRNTDVRVIPSKGKALYGDKGDLVPEIVDYHNSLGAEAWELVSVQERDVVAQLHVTYYFKRPKE